MSLIRSEYSASLNFFGSASPSGLTGVYGSPVYVYNENVLRKRCAEMKNLVTGLTVCYSTKANGNPHLLRIIREEGLIADAMSPGEIALLHRAGFKKESINYVCNNVSPEELVLAVRECAHVSVDSLSQLETFGKLSPGSAVMARVNPGIGAGHSDKVVTAGKKTKFGIAPGDFPAMRSILARHQLRLVGLNQHVGSLFMDSEPFLDAAKWLLETAKDFPGLHVLSFGGGFGIPYNKYKNEPRLNLEELSSRFGEMLQSWRDETGFEGQFVIEPGRYVVAECGILLGTVHAVKNNGPTRFVGTDIGFNVLARPLLYDAFHDVELYPQDEEPRTGMMQTIVGNICESGDVLAQGRLLPEMREGDCLGILDAGAYGFSMSSCYNQRLRPAEVLIRKDGSPQLIRRRDHLEELLSYYPE